MRQLIQAFLLWALEKVNPDFAQSREALLAEIARLREDREAQQKYNAELDIELGLLEEKYLEQRRIAEQLGNQVEALQQSAETIRQQHDNERDALAGLSDSDVLHRL